MLFRPHAESSSDVSECSESCNRSVRKKLLGQVLSCTSNPDGKPVLLAVESHLDWTDDLPPTKMGFARRDIPQLRSQAIHPNQRSLTGSPVGGRRRHHDFGN
jgi:hypothetical protein